MNTIDTSLAPQLARPTSGQAEGELGQDDYLTLMVAQIQNQDPFSPMENGQFVAELAQFSTVSGIESLNQNFTSLADSISSDQTLQASGLIGRDVLLNQSTGYRSADEALGGAVDMPIASSNVTVAVRDASGAVVRNIPLGAQTAGLARFQWDGRDARGETMPAGRYTFTANIDVGGAAQAVPALVRSRVDSVSLASQGGGLSLNLPGLDALPLSQIREIS
ncbi:MAG: flagellar hook assembly protein FlgD [Gammaproteobacteria bacterium]